MRLLAVAAVVAALISPAGGDVLAAQTAPPDGPPGGEPVRVVVNSQRSLAEAVGDGFRDEAWDYPAGLVPDEFPGLVYVTGPADPGLWKAAWRKPITLCDKAAGVEVALNCYRVRRGRRRRPGRAPPSSHCSNQTTGTSRRSSTGSGPRARRLGSGTCSRSGTATGCSRSRRPGAGLNRGERRLQRWRRRCGSSGTLNRSRPGGRTSICTGAAIRSWKNGRRHSSRPGDAGRPRI